jgi:hypothetical protein
MGKEETKYEKVVSKTSTADAETNPKAPEVVEDTPEARNRRLQNESVETNKRLRQQMKDDTEAREKASKK